MASRQVLLLAAAAIAAAFLPAPTSAVDFMVGGDAGWTLNYTIGWPDGKTFKVGDNLVFKYLKGNHTVVEVDSQTFKDCYRQGNTLGTWASGNDTVKLDKAVKRWFFCSVADHCEKGLKLVVDIVDDGAKAPASPPKSPPASPPKSPPASPPKSPPASPPASPPKSPPAFPSTSSSATLSYKVGGAVAQAMVVAGAVVAAVFM